jgi:hypothetical protein
MKRILLIPGFILVIFFAGSMISHAQCSICTRTAQQLGEKPAKGLNAGIIYLAFTPFAIAGYVAYRWWKNNRLD